MKSARNKKRWLKQAMSSRKLVGLLILNLAVGSIAMAATSPAQIEQAIGNKVYCMCGCATALNHCPHPNCDVKTEMHRIIRTDLAAGKTEPVILNDLVAKYGIKVLAAPPAAGFNLTAWILPGVGLIIGLLIALTLVRRWRRPAVATATSATPAAPVNDQLRAAVEEEMKKFSG